MNEQQLQALVNAVVGRMQTQGIGTQYREPNWTGAATPPTPYRIHGQQGLLSVPGLDPNILNASVSPMSGLWARLPFTLSNETDPTYGIFTGVTASSGAEPTEACAPARQPGNLKICRQHWTFGRVVMDSSVLQYDRLGEIINRSEFQDYRLIGNPLTTVDMVNPVSMQDALRNEVNAALFKLYFAIHRDYGHLIYDGNPANTDGSTGYYEPNGFARIINTGYQDVVTQQRCKAADSLVKAFGNVDVKNNAIWAYTLLTEMIRHLRYRARQAGMRDVNHIIAMPYSLFMQLTELWPCGYSTYRCNPENAAVSVNLEATAANALREAMRNGSYLLIDDQPVEVVVDDFLPETEIGSGTFQTDVYILPLTANGERLTYTEYFNLAGPNGAQALAREMTLADFFEVIAGGRMWLHRKPPTNECLQVRMGYKPRFICKAPFLAGRITGMRYTPLIKELSGFPGNPNHYNGGSYQWPATTFYNNVV